MATTGYSDYQTAVRAASGGSLHTRALQNKIMMKHSAIEMLYLGRGVELNSEFVDLGSPCAINARFSPESLRIRFTGTAAFSVPVKFAKLTTVDGTTQNGRAFNCSWTRSSTTATVTTASPHGFSTNQHLSFSNSSDTAAIPNGATGVIMVLSETVFTMTVPNAGATSGTGTVGEVISAQRVYTYTRSTTTVTVTSQGAHGLSSNDILLITAGFDVLSMPTPGALGLTGVITVTSRTAFTFACTDAGAASGSITIGPAAGNYVPITSSVAFTEAAVYTGAPPIVATTTITPFGMAESPVFRKEDKLILIWGVITTVPPATRVYWISGTYSHIC